MSEEKLNRVCLFLVLGCFFVSTIYLFVTYEERPPIPLECIEKLEQFAGENSFDIIACRRDLAHASELRAERGEVCQ